MLDKIFGVVSSATTLFLFRFLNILLKLTFYFYQHFHLLCSIVHLNEVFLWALAMAALLAGHIKALSVEALSIQHWGLWMYFFPFSGQVVYCCILSSGQLLPDWSLFPQFHLSNKFHNSKPALPGVWMLNVWHIALVASVLVDDDFKVTSMLGVEDASSLGVKGVMWTS
jgi:hypothetical protein